MENITKKEIVSSIRRETGLKLVDINMVVNSLLHNIEKELSAGNSVQFAGFGTFKMKKRAAKSGTNPHTGEIVRIPEKIVPYFDAGARLKRKTTKPV